MAAQRLASLQEQSSAPAPLSTAWGEAAAVTAAVMLGYAVRFFRLGKWSFWPDEIFSFGTRSDGFNDSILRRSLATDLIGLAVRTLGPNEWSARLVPALVGVATIPLLYLLHYERPAWTMYPKQLAALAEHAEPQAEFDVRLPGRTYRMRVYLAECP